jgi:periplasmic protein CpxP/Spy
MKKRTSILILTIVAAIAFVAAPLVFAGPGGKRMRGHGMHGGHFGGGILGHMRHMKEELNLSDAQSEQLKTIFREMHEQNAASRDSFHDGFHDAALALLANPNDVAGAQAILDRQAAAERTLRQNLLAATAKALNVLTPEQRTKLSQKINERHARRNRTE